MMAEKKKIYTINQIKMRIAPVLEEYGVKKATLFGSYSQGRATEKSDIDLLVDSGLRGLRFVGLIEDLRTAVDKTVDVLDITHIQAGTEIEDEIRRTGVVIYEGVNRKLVWEIISDDLPEMKRVLEGLMQETP